MRKKTKQYIDKEINGLIELILDDVGSALSALSTRITRLETGSYRTTGSPLD